MINKDSIDEDGFEEIKNCQDEDGNLRIEEEELPRVLKAGNKFNKNFKNISLVP